MAAKFMRAKISILVCAFSLTVFTCSINGQFRLFGPKQPRPTPQPVRKASELIQRQAPLKVNQSLLNQATTDNTRIVVSLPKQSTYLMIGGDIVADGQISSGQRGHCTARDTFTVMYKEPTY